TAAVAADTGLREGTPIVAGGGDQAAVAVGVGAVVLVPALVYLFRLMSRGVFDVPKSDLDAEEGTRASPS
ncbi:hypothetical protein LCGC14_2793710, partial [marine sediment metagenome]